MSDERSQMMFDILLGIQHDVRLIRRELAAMGARLAAMDEFAREWRWRLAEAAR